MSIQIEHLTHTYQPGSPYQATAIHDVTMTVADGELLALIGHTGSGKSTLAQHMNGLLTPTSGRVLVDGEDINQKGADRRAVRRKVGLVFQYPEHQLFEETVARDIAFGPKNLGLSPEESKARALEAMDRVGLPREYAERSPFELSGGQMRRAALAGVLAMRPETLLLDEPAAGLDPRGRSELYQLISRLHDEGVTCVLISHSMDDVSRLATRIAVLKEGALAMQGTPEQVFSQGKLLSAMGLDIPQTLRLSLALREWGVDAPDCFREEDMLAALSTLLRLLTGEQEC